MINPGKLNHRLTFQRPIQSSDGVGSGGTITWTDAFTTWAEKWSVKGSERVEAARNKQNAIFRWHCRFRSTIVPSMRIKWTNAGKTHYQEVISATPLDNKMTEMEVLAEEKT